MDKVADLDRFLEAQKNTYDKAYQEIKAGRKQSHWMWFIFPQMLGLGFSEMATRYGIANLKEAEDYLNHPILGQRLISISKLLPEIHDKSAYEIFGSPDDMKLRSSMTLFSLAKNADPIFQTVIDQYFNGKKDGRTTALLAVS